MRSLMFAVVAVIAAMSALAAQSPGTCAPHGTATCDPSGRPVTGGTNPTPPGAGTGTSVPTVAAVTATVTLGGGKAVSGAEGLALDTATGLVYVGLNGAIVGAKAIHRDPAAPSSSRPERSR